MSPKPSPAAPLSMHSDCQALLGGPVHALLVFPTATEPAGKVQDGDVPWTPCSGLQGRAGHLCRQLHDDETNEDLPELTVPAKHCTRHHPGQERKTSPKDEEEVALGRALVPL